MATEPTKPKDFPSRLGRAFLFGAWIVALALLTLVFQDLLDDQRNPNRDVQSVVTPDAGTSVVLQRNRSGHYVASGTLNGEPVVFLVDTGATDVALPAEVARRLGIQGGAPVVSRTANGTTTGWATRLDSVAIGGLVLRNVRALILPNMPGQEVLLGMSFLKRLELVQSGDTLTLTAPNRL